MKYSWGSMDYFELPRLLGDAAAGINEKSSVIEKRILEKAQMINKRMGANNDLATHKNLISEMKHIEDIAELLDEIKAVIDVFRRTVNETQSDYWSACRLEREKDEKIAFMQETITILLKREKGYLDLIKTNVVNTRKGKVHIE